VAGTTRPPDPGADPRGARRGDARGVSGLQGVDTPGGILRRADGALVGDVTAEFIGQFKVDYAIIGSAAVVAIGLPVADPIIGLAITAVILRITWQSWQTVRGSARQ